MCKPCVAPNLVIREEAKTFGCILTTIRLRVGHSPGLSAVYVEIEVPIVLWENYD